MPTFERIYNDAQREAVTAAYLDRGIRPQRRILELAEAGQLPHEGANLPPFTMNIHSLRDIIVRERKRRRGRIHTELDIPADDLNEALRRRMIHVVDTTLQAEEKRAPEKRDPERLRQIARAMREAVALPGKGEGRSRRPGDREGAEQPEGPTRGGIGAQILRDARKTAAEHHTPEQRSTENGSAAQQRSDDSEDTAVALPDPRERDAATLRPMAHTHA